MLSASAVVSSVGVVSTPHEISVTVKRKVNTVTKKSKSNRFMALILILLLFLSIISFFHEKVKIFYKFLYNKNKTYAKIIKNLSHPLDKQSFQYYNSLVLWKRSSAGQSARFTSVRSWVRAPSFPPKIKGWLKPSFYFCCKLHGFKPCNCFAIAKALCFDCFQIQLRFGIVQGSEPP